MGKVDADIAFIGPGFELHGGGDLAGVAVNHFDAGIVDFGETPLYVKATTQTETGALLAMLKQSPLHHTYAETLDNLTAKGPAKVTYDLLQPLHPDQGPGHMLGTVDLQGVALTEKRFALAFDAMRGQARYSRDGFGAEGPLQVAAQQGGFLAAEEQEGGRFAVARLRADQLRDDCRVPAVVQGRLRCQRRGVGNRGSVSKLHRVRIAVVRSAPRLPPFARRALARG